jgi:hypothetical protein
MPDKMVIRISAGVMVLALAIISEMLEGEKSIRKATTFCFVSAIFSFSGAIMPLRYHLLHLHGSNVVGEHAGGRESRCTCLGYMGTKTAN